MPRSILLVEADDTLSILWAYNLECEGYQVHLAADGEEALEMLESHAPDLVMVDSLQPPASAAELCRRIRRSRGGSRIPILLITDDTRAAELAQGYAGADERLPMPFGVDELRDCVRGLLEGSASPGAAAAGTVPSAAE